MPDPANIPAAGNEVEPNELETRWKSRAARLAQLAEQKASGEQIQLLIFRLGDEFYGFEVQYVIDIRLAGEIAPVPRVPDWVVGVVTIRGRIMSVIDLARYFQLPKAAPAQKNGENHGPADLYQVSVETADMEIALLVDEVLSIEPVPLNQIESQPGLWGEMRPEAVRGLARFSNARAGVDATSLIVLNLPALLADKNLIIEEKIL